MRRFKFAVVIFLLLTVFSCSWMNSETASTFASEKVLTADESKAFLTHSIYVNSARCDTLVKPGLFMISKGFDRILTRSFYYKDSLDTCFATMLVVPCPVTELGDTDAINFYRFVLNSCKPKPYEL
ncbi:MAG: hypothetical protein H3C43_07890 [Leptonema sp. (in: Bacteria)]|nr:hypothetical protein [Leptonema sp. (in: bacteria)]